MKYFISIKGEKRGPYNLDKLRNLNLFSTTLVWKEGMQDWQHAYELDDLKDITHTPPPPLPKGKISTDEIVKIFFIHLLFGAGFFYVDKTIQRKFLYPAFGLYALLDLILGPGLDIEPFDSGFGGVTFIISLVICYLIGYIDVYHHRYIISKVEKTETNKIYNITRSEKKQLIIEKLENINIDLIEYLEIWKNQGGGTTGHAIGSVILGIKEKTEFFKNSC